MKTLVTIVVLLMGVLAFANDELEVYIEEPNIIPHELPPITPLPPLTASQCTKSYVCDKNGNNCKWIVVCK